MIIWEHEKREAEHREILKAIADLSISLGAAHLKSESAQNKANEALAVLKDRTTMSVDVGAHAAHINQIILTGTFKGRDYVETFHVQSDSFEQFVGMCREMERNSTLRRIDAPMGHYRSVFEKEILHY